MIHKHAGLDVTEAIIDVICRFGATLIHKAHKACIILYPNQCNPVWWSKNLAHLKATASRIAPASLAPLRVTTEPVAFVASSCYGQLLTPEQLMGDFLASKAKGHQVAQAVASLVSRVGPLLNTEKEVTYILQAVFKNYTLAMAWHLQGGLRQSAGDSDCLVTIAATTSTTTTPASASTPSATTTNATTSSTATTPASASTSSAQFIPRTDKRLHGRVLLVDSASSIAAARVIAARRELRGLIALDCEGDLSPRGQLALV